MKDHFLGAGYPRFDVAATFHCCPHVDRKETIQVLPLPPHKHTDGQTERRTHRERFFFPTVKIQTQTNSPTDKLCLEHPQRQDYQQREQQNKPFLFFGGQDDRY